MSSPLQLLRQLRLPEPTGIIHVGASIGQEISSYKNSKAKNCVYIEPIPFVFEKLKNNIGSTPNHYAVQALCSDFNNEEVVFNVASNQGESSSMFALGKHAVLHPNVKYVDSFKIKTKTLESIINQEFPQTEFDLLVMDTQGSELKVLQGSHKLLKQINYVYSEISEEPLYENSCTFEEVTSLLKLYGFKLKNMSLNYNNWGNALYVKDQLEIPKPPGENLALHKLAQQSSLSPWSTDNNDSQGAVNGIKNGQFNFHTNKELNPWWQVDLESIYTIEQVRVYNRCDGNHERANTLRILLSSNGNDWKQVYAHGEKSPIGGINTKPLIVEINNKTARYVRLQLNEENYLHLDEVEVYGIPV